VAIDGQQTQILGHGLGDEHAIEWIAMVVGEGADGFNVRKFNLQKRHPVRRRKSARSSRASSFPKLFLMAISQREATLTTH
jgi:hypothetical protein